MFLIAELGLTAVTGASGRSLTSLTTVGWLTPNIFATFVFALTSAHGTTIRARVTSATPAFPLPRHRLQSFSLPGAYLQRLFGASSFIPQPHQKSRPRTIYLSFFNDATLALDA